MEVNLENIATVDNLLHAKSSSMRSTSNTVKQQNSCTDSMKQSETNRKRKYRAEKRQSETEEELLKHRRTEASYSRKYWEAKKKYSAASSKQIETERKRRYREQRRQSETEEESLKHKQKEAEHKQKQRQTWKRNDAGNEESTRSRKQMRQYASKEQLLDQWQKDAARQRKRYTQKKNKKDFVARKNLDDFDENLVAYENIGGMKYTCDKCGACMFKGEKTAGSFSTANPTAKFSLCCSNGEIQLPPTKEPPEKLKKLLTGNTKRDHDFQTNIRGYNSSLAFASMNVSGVEHKFTKGPYCYRISGQVYHALSQMQPPHGRKPCFSQIYIYDQENELNNQLASFQ